MSEALRSRLRSAADSIAQAVEDELAAHRSGERLLTMEQLGALLDVHPATVRRRHREGRLGFPLFEVAGELRARQSDFDAWTRELPLARVLKGLELRPRSRYRLTA